MFTGPNRHARLSRELVKRESVGTLATVYPSDYRIAGLAASTPGKTASFTVRVGESPNGFEPDVGGFDVGVDQVPMSGWDDPTPLSGMVNRDPPSNQKNPVRTGWRGWGKSMFAGWQAKAAERGPAATARVALMGNVTVFYGVTGEGDTEADLEARQMSECFWLNILTQSGGYPGVLERLMWRGGHGSILKLYSTWEGLETNTISGGYQWNYIVIVQLRTRIFRAELTTLYFVLSVVHCVLQVILQLAAHAINVNARHLVTHILEQAKLTMDKFALVENKRRVPQVRTTDLTLTLCRGIPGQFGFTGKDVCDVLWSQSRGLVNDTVEDFLSPSSESDDNNNKSSSDSDDDKTTSPLPVQAPTVSFSSTRASSTFASSTSNSVSTFPVAPTLVSSTPTLSSTSRRTTTSLSVSITTTSFVASTSSPHDSPTSSTFTSFPSETSTTTGPTAPTGIQNLIRPRPGSGSSDSGSDNDTGVISAHFVRRRALKQRSTVSESRDSTRKVFDREKLRPLSLPRSQPRVPSQSSSVDIDESHPDLKTHIRRARVAPITNSLLKRTLEGSTLEYIPIAPRAVDPMRFVSRHSRRTKRSRNLTARSPFISDEQDVKITPIWRFEVDSDDEKKHQSGNLAGNSTVPMNMNRGKPILVSVKISGLVGPGMGDQQIMAGNGTAATFGDVELSPGCALALSWPAQVLRDFAREDLAMIGFQVWLLGMSVVAILNESVPHMVAGLFTQALSTGWSAFQMARSASFRAQYGETIVRGACSGVDVLPEYFTHRTTDEIPIVVFNAVFLITMTILSWRVCKVYGWQTFKRIGASRVMNRAYRLVLAFSIHLQCAVYFFVTSSALWVDELLNGSIACFAEHQGLYKGVFITSILLLLPWLILGWIGVRRENKLMMHAFLIISLLFITAWAAMFASDVYRWSFATWPFFAAMTVTSFVVLVATTGLAIVCRYNFKKGLALFLQSQQILPSGDFTDAMPDPEKVGFPAQRAGEELPTFSVAFGHGGVPQPPSQMFPVQPAAAVSRSTTLSNDRPAGYSVNPYVTNRSDFWGEGNVARSASMRSKSSTDTSSAPTIRSTDPMLFDHDIPRYSSEEEPDSVRRELPHHPTCRSNLRLKLGHNWIGIALILRELLGREPVSLKCFVMGWQKVDARELYRASIVSGVTHASGFSGASWARGDDAGPLPTRAAVPVPPVPAYRPLQAPLPVAAAPRAFVGLPGKNIKPQTTASGRVTQQFSPPQATGVLGGVAVPPGW
ncbi:hypothetical protein RhiXN_06975 [Rhizoctonia solani]|uniref:Uncharacterized protein n=1 Tax=Rhizoctonia solani TaxID=456999 RepID=A0A8H8P709_9AGAM|nr:uncharacterized protein RhiXN_06975 [Rhizoctonia solani]QRW25026.1 hypothetical protein RhiXN_06975 [Rhizoctonia solani]